MSDFDPSPSQIQVIMMLRRRRPGGRRQALRPRRRDHPRLPSPSPLAIAVKVDVPWDRAGQAHAWLLELLDADGMPVLIGDQPVVVQGQFEVGPHRAAAARHPATDAAGRELQRPGPAGRAALRVAPGDRRRDRAGLAGRLQRRPPAHHRRLSPHRPAGPRGGADVRTNSRLGSCDDDPVKRSRPVSCRLAEADLVSQGATADPSAEADLVDLATRRHDLKATRERSERVRRGAHSRQEEAERAAKVRASAVAGANPHDVVDGRRGSRPSSCPRTTPPSRRSWPSSNNGSSRPTARPATTSRPSPTPPMPCWPPSWPAAPPSASNHHRSRSWPTSPAYPASPSRTAVRVRVATDGPGAAASPGLPARHDSPTPTPPSEPSRPTCSTRRPISTQRPRRLGLPFELLLETSDSTVGADPTSAEKPPTNPTPRVPVDHPVGSTVRAGRRHRAAARLCRSRRDLRDPRRRARRCELGPPADRRRHLRRGHPRRRRHPHRRQLSTRHIPRPLRVALEVRDRSCTNPDLWRDRTARDRPHRRLRRPPTTPATPTSTRSVPATISQTRTPETRPGHGGWGRRRRGATAASRPVRRAMISAQIETAVSSGVRAPMSSPIGAMIRARLGVVDARLGRSRSTRSAWVRRDCPSRRGSRRRCRSAATMAGTSNLWSWVSTHTASRGPSVGADPLEQAVRPVDDDLVGHREPPPGGEHLAGVAHRHPVAEHLGHLDQRGGEVDGAEDQHLRRRGERLDEDRRPRRSRASPCGAVVAHAGACRPRARRGRRGPTTRSRSGSPSDAERRRAPGRDQQLGADVRALDHRGQRHRLLGRAAPRASAS